MPMRGTLLSLFNPVVSQNWHLRLSLVAERDHLQVTDGSSVGRPNVLSLTCSARAHVPKPCGAAPATIRAAHSGAGGCRAACRPPNYD